MFNHPLLFAAVAVFAVGVVIYQAMSGREQKQGVYRRRPRSPPPPDSKPPRPPPAPDSRPRRPPPAPDSKPPQPPPAPDSKPPQPPPAPDSKPPRPPTAPDSKPPRPPTAPDSKPPPESRSPQPPPASDSTSPPYFQLPGGINAPSDSEVPYSSAPGSNLRKRNVKKTSSHENASENSKNAAKVSLEIDVKKASETSTANSENCPDKRFDENNYCKNMLDKLTNDTKDIGENIRSEKNLRHNIYEEESDSSENNFPTKSEAKSINQTTADEKICNSIKPCKRKRKSKHPRHTNKHTIDQSSKSHSCNIYPKIESISNPPSNSGSEITESSSSSDEDAFKREMLEVFRNDVHNIYENNPDNSMCCSSEEIKHEEPPELELCQACEKKHINTRAYPCGHSYLCADCAIRLFRLSKKCSICLQHVTEFVQFAS